MRSTEKRELFLGLMRLGLTKIYVDARRPGVMVPPKWKDEKALVLEYGYDMPVPIRDLNITDDGISAVLSFGRTAEATFVPWTAVFIVSMSESVTGVVGKHWAEDTPVEDISKEKPVRRLRSV